MICHCRAVNDRRIREVARSTGATSPEQLARHCDAGTGCGGCLPAVRRVLDQLVQA
jgi:bacterioferritin-associated ferredoxin